MKVFKALQIRYFIYTLILLIFLSCSNDDEVNIKLDEYDLEVISYFKDIALGFEYGTSSEITRKWCSDLKIFVGGDITNDLNVELNNIVNEIRSLVTDNFSIQIVNDSSQSNYYIFFGSGDEYSKIFPSQANYVDSNWGLFSIWWDESNCLNRGNMYVDIYRANNIGQKHLLREELTQSLGLGKDSSKYPNSIFQSSWTQTLNYLEIDKDVIRLLYHPKMKIGVDRYEVDNLLREILLGEK